MANTFNISRTDIERHPAPFDFAFEWDNGAEKTFIVVSLHGAKALAETFKSFGYEEEEGSVQFINFESEDHSFIFPQFKKESRPRRADGTWKRDKRV